MASIEVKRTDPGIKEMLQATFPDYRGRKISIRGAERPLDVTSFWDGGSRSYFKAVDLSDLRRVMAVPQNGTPFDGGPIRPNGLEIPEGFAIVERAYFMGRGAGVTIHVNPATLPSVLPAPTPAPRSRVILIGGPQ